MSQQAPSQDPVVGGALTLNPTLKEEAPPTTAHPLRPVQELARRLPVGFVLRVARTFTMGTNGELRALSLTSEAQRFLDPHIALIDDAHLACGDSVDANGMLCPGVVHTRKRPGLAIGLAWSARCWVRLASLYAAAPESIDAWRRTCSQVHREVADLLLADLREATP